MSQNTSESTNAVQSETPKSVILEWLSKIKKTTTDTVWNVLHHTEIVKRMEALSESTLSPEKKEKIKITGKGVEIETPEGKFLLALTDVSKLQSFSKVEKGGIVLTKDQWESILNFLGPDDEVRLHFFEKILEMGKREYWTGSLDTGSVGKQAFILFLLEKDLGGMVSIDSYHTLTDEGVPNTFGVGKGSAIS